VWQPGDPAPRLDIPVAHNASNFDRFADGPCGWDVRGEWEDSSSAARRAGLPGALDALGKRWLGVDKDAAGSRFTLALSRPSRAKARAGQLPDLTPEVRERVVRYCYRDVRIMAKAWDRLAPWLDVDREVCEVDRVINDRGVYLDKDMVRALQRQLQRQQDEAVRAAAREIGRSESEARAMASSPQKLTAYTGLPNAQADTLKDALKSDLFKRQGGLGSVELCKARLALASVVPGKLTAALLRVSDDNRMRDAKHYYGAHTGRWSSKGMQIDNLPRVSFEEDAKKIGWGCNDYVEALCQGAIADEELSKNEVSGCLRACLVAAPGKVLTVLDYRGVEARANAWAAGDKSALEVFAALDAGVGADPYCIMASRIFGREITKADKSERGIGKIAELACFAAGTLVLTDRGYVPIVDVRTLDMLWDGVEWVKHSGLVSRGVREVVPLAGVSATSDHRVLSDRWTTWGALAESESALSRALERGSANLPSLGISEDRAEAYRLWSCGVVAAIASTQLTLRTFSPAEPHGVTNAPSAPQARHESIFGGTPRYAQTRTTGIDCFAAYRPQHSGATIRAIKPTQTTEGEAFGCTYLGAETGLRSCATCSPSRGGITPRSTSIESTTTQATRQATCGSLPRERTSATDRPCVSCERLLPRLRPVYDIANAGPRHRFTILTDQGPLLVHNCGYGMGGPKFQSDNGDKLEAQGVAGADVVRAWRELHAPITRMWRACERAFASACEGRTARAGKWRYEPHGRDVWCVLPSERPIVYPSARARRVTRKTHDGRSFEAWDLTYQGTNPWPEHVYGGLLVENAIQALCRDFLADALVRCEKAGLSPVGHVHDELICENDRRAAKEALAEQREIMLDVPEWAHGMPMGTDGFESKRYRK